MFGVSVLLLAGFLDSSHTVSTGVAMSSKLVSSLTYLPGKAGTAGQWLALLFLHRVSPYAIPVHQISYTVSQSSKSECSRRRGEMGAPRLLIMT